MTIHKSELFVASVVMALCVAACGGADYEREADFVDFDLLLSGPDDYYGAEIVIDGFLTDGFETDYVWASKDDVGNCAKAIGYSVPKSVNIDNWNNKHVAVRGTFMTACWKSNNSSQENDCQVLSGCQNIDNIRISAFLEK